MNKYILFIRNYNLIVRRICLIIFRCKKKLCILLITSIVWRYAQEFQNSLKAMKQMKPKETEGILPLFHLKRFVHASKTVNTTHWHCDWRSNIRGDFGVQHINLQHMIFWGRNRIDWGDCVYRILSTPPLWGNVQLHVADPQWEIERLHVHRPALF